MHVGIDEAGQDPGGLRGRAICRRAIGSRQSGDGGDAAVGDGERGGADRSRDRINEVAGFKKVSKSSLVNNTNSPVPFVVQIMIVTAP